MSARGMCQLTSPLCRSLGGWTPSLRRSALRLSFSRADHRAALRSRASITGGASPARNTGSLTLDALGLVHPGEPAHGAGQVGFTQSGPTQVGIAQVDLGQVRVAQSGPVQVGSGEVGIAQI